MHIHKYINFCLLAARMDWRDRQNRISQRVDEGERDFSLFSNLYLSAQIRAAATSNTQAAIQTESCRRRMEQRVGIVIVWLELNYEDFNWLTRMFVQKKKRNINFWISQFPACSVLCVGWWTPKCLIFSLFSLALLWFIFCCRPQLMPQSFSFCIDSCLDFLAAVVRWETQFDFEFQTKTSKKNGQIVQFSWKNR